MNSMLAPIALALLLQAPAAEAPKIPPTEQIMQESAQIGAHVTTPFAKSLLAGYGCLQPVRPITIYVHTENRDVISAAEGAKLTTEQLRAYTKRDIDDRFYYYTRYGTPVAFVRPMEILGKAGVKTAEGLKLVDFGFGSIGQLRALAGSGADVTGIEVDPVLKMIYAAEPGKVTRCVASGKGRDGSINLAFGQFPKDPAVVKQVGGGYDVFVSKNTLKRGYIHPEKKVDPRMLVHLEVDDETFVKSVYDALKPGGFFLIYNLHPAPSKPTEEYIPWSDGRCPFTAETFGKVGFKVLAYDLDDTKEARVMGQTFGWGTPEELETTIFGTYTLVQKP